MNPGALEEMLQVCKILQSSTRLLVLFESIPADNTHVDTVNVADYPLSEALLKPNTRHRGRHLDAQWRDSETDHAVFLEEKLLRKLRGIESELPEDVHHPGGIRRASGDPDVDVPRRSRIPVVSDGIAADQ